MNEIRIAEAETESIPMIERIAAATIRTVYPKYYPGEVVEFFLGLHQRAGIETDVQERKSWSGANRS